MLLYHGSQIILDHPEYGKGNTFNDYGPGFYSTEHIDLAREWACKDISGGYVNSYSFVHDGLKTLNLNQYTVLHWLALLVHNRRFRLTSELMAEGEAWLEDKYLLDISNYDVIIGYRADDSYFRFARAFLQNSLSLEVLDQAMHLGELGEQVVLVSPEAFQNISFQNAEWVDGSTFYQRRLERDRLAREQFVTIQRESSSNGVFLMDLLRGEVALP
ncbi:MAG: DUF3990 domain-containing protein [Clostridia bacterium]|nr:DUF3990 domain-containing protein [Clostridia bacterium]